MQAAWVLGRRLWCVEMGGWQEGWRDRKRWLEGQRDRRTEGKMEMKKDGSSASPACQHPALLRGARSCPIGSQFPEPQQMLNLVLTGFAGVTQKKGSSKGLTWLFFSPKTLLGHEETGPSLPALAASAETVGRSLLPKSAGVCK